MLCRSNGQTRVADADADADDAPPSFFIFTKVSKQSEHIKWPQGKSSTCTIILIIAT